MDTEGAQRGLHAMAADVDEEEEIFAPAEIDHAIAVAAEIVARQVQSGVAERAAEARCGQDMPLGDRGRVEIGLEPPIGLARPDVRRGEVAVAPPQPPLELDDPLRRAEGDLERGGIDRLGEEGIDLYFERRRLLAPARRHHDDVEIMAGRIRPERPRQSEAVEFGHLPVGDEHVDIAFADRGERRAAIAHATDVTADLFDLHRNQFGEQRVVVGDQHFQPRVDHRRWRQVIDHAVGHAGSSSPAVIAAFDLPNTEQGRTFFPIGRPIKGFVYAARRHAKCWKIHSASSAGLASPSISTEASTVCCHWPGRFSIISSSLNTPRMRVPDLTGTRKRTLLNP